MCQTSDPGHSSRCDPAARRTWQQFSAISGAWSSYFCRQACQHKGSKVIVEATPIARVREPTCLDWQAFSAQRASVTDPPATLDAAFRIFIRHSSGR